MFDRFFCMLGFLGMASVMSILRQHLIYIQFVPNLRVPINVIPGSLNYLNYFVNRHIGFKNILIAFLYTSFEARAFTSARQVQKLSKVGGGGGLQPSHPSPWTRLWFYPESKIQVKKKPYYCYTSLSCCCYLLTSMM